MSVNEGDVNEIKQSHGYQLMSVNAYVSGNFVYVLLGKQLSWVFNATMQEYKLSIEQ